MYAALLLFAARMRLGENLLTPSNIAAASNSRTETGFRTRPTKTVSVDFWGRGASGSFATQLGDIPAILPDDLICRANRRIDGWSCRSRCLTVPFARPVRRPRSAVEALTTLQSLHVLLSDVARHSSDVPDHPPSYDRRWDSHRYRAQPLQYRTGRSTATQTCLHRTAPKAAPASKGSTIA